jgi:hypothetical protein
MLHPILYQQKFPPADGNVEKVYTIWSHSSFKELSFPTYIKYKCSTVLKNSGRLFQLIPNDDYVPIIYEIAKYRFSLCLAEFFLSYL